MKLDENKEKLRVSDDHDKISNDFRRSMEQEYLSQEVVLDFLRKCSPELVSSVTLVILPSFIDRVTDVRINLNDFSEMYPSESDYELKVLQLFASRKATQITFLEIDGAVNPSENNPPLIESQMWTEITKFKYLKNLSINKHQFLLNDLMKMCKNMPNLNEILVVIDCDSEFPVDDPQFVQEFSSSFDKIKEFIFAPLDLSLNSTKAINFAGKLTKFGIRHLPNLKWFATIGLYSDMFEACQEMDQKSGVQYLHLNAIYLEEFASKFEKFSSVLTLMVSWSELNDVSKDSKFDKKKLKLLKKFTKINNLYLNNLASTEYLRVLLNNLGPQLQILTLSYETKQKMTINLKQIQETCPLLSNLAINLADVEKIQSLACFTSLKNLWILYDVYSSDKLRLSNLLDAPNLEMVNLSGFQVTRQELQETTSKIKEKAILTKVNELEIYLKGETSEKLKNALEKEGKLFVRALLKMRQIDEKAVKLEFL